MLTPEEQREAAELGWELRDVYDLKRKRVVLIPMSRRFPAESVMDTWQTVWRQAMARQQVAIRALAVMRLSNL